MALTHQLANVQFAAPAHLGRPSVADVRVVFPHDDARGAIVAVQVRQQMVEGVGHVPVSQVPGADRVAEHRPVVLLGIADEDRVLLGGEVVVLGQGAVARR